MTDAKDSSTGGGEYGSGQEQPRRELPGTDYRYDADGKTIIYTDPATKAEYVPNADNSGWVPRDAAGAGKQQGAGFAKGSEDYDFDGTTYSYVDKSTGKKFKWNLDKKEW